MKLLDMFKGPKGDELVVSMKRISAFVLIVVGIVCAFLEKSEGMWGCFATGGAILGITGLTRT